MSGVDIMELDAEAIVAVCYSSIVDDVVELGVSRHEVRDKINQRLGEIVFQYNARKHRESPETVAKPEAEAFRLTPEMASMINLQSPVKIQPKE